jgi:hypothetical protein
MAVATVGRARCALIRVWPEMSGNRSAAMAVATVGRVGAAAWRGGKREGESRAS